MILQVLSLLWSQNYEDMNVTEIQENALVLYILILTIVRNFQY
jgi:hypothetical protein